jgi:hypothetical protein
LAGLPAAVASVPAFLAGTPLGADAADRANHHSARRHETVRPFAAPGKPRPSELACRRQRASARRSGQANPVRPSAAGRSNPPGIQFSKLAQDAENKPDPEIDIPAEITRREDLVAKIDEARAKIEEREALRHAQIKAKHAERLALRKELQRNGKKPRGRRPKLPKLRVEPTAQINLTDEESRIMPTSYGFVQGYNAQAAVSIESQLIVHAHVTQATNDKQQLVPALEGLQALPECLGVLSDIVADAGYYSEANVVACEGLGVTPYLAMSRERHHSWLDAKLRKPNSVPAEGASPADRMAYRLQTPDGHELYAQRKSTVETTFGILKSAIGFRSFLLRGCEKVEGEWKLVCTAYNLKRLYGLVAACPKVQAAA